MTKTIAVTLNTIIFHHKLLLGFGLIITFFLPTYLPTYLFPSSTYQYIYVWYLQLAAFFQSNGLAPGKCVSIFSENSHRWLAIDQVSF